MDFQAKYAQGTKWVEQQIKKLNGQFTLDFWYVNRGRVIAHLWDNHSMLACKRFFKLEKLLEYLEDESQTEITLTDTALAIVLDGCGTKTMDNGPVVYIECEDEKWVVYVWAEIDSEDYTHRIEMTGAQECNLGEMFQNRPGSP